jgi:hypothetical protein
MFRIEFFCDDKKLPLVLHAIAGLALGDPKIAPVINAERAPKGGGVKQITNGKLLDLFAVYLTKTKATEITPQDAQAFLKNAGRSPQSASYMLRNAVEHHMLKRGSGKGAQANYLVVPHKGG